MLEKAPVYHPDIVEVMEKMNFFLKQESGGMRIDFQDLKLLKALR
ncbi:MAG: hypothetical protein NT166_25980 [Candidatus Aminicenantes bacterium]|nr:hypothetical protein [Candidatus Aminicenantes bacterium]